MSKVRECFVCGMLLAQTERQRVEVSHDSDAVRDAEACQACWWKLRGKRVLKVVKKGRSYEVRVRRLQFELFGATARRVMRGG